MWLVFAAGAAACFGLRAILYQWTSKQPADRNVLLFGVYLCGAVISFLLNAVYAQPWTPGAWVGLVMGVFSFIANATMHKGFSVGKASIVAILTGLAPVVVVCGAYLLWGEKLTWEQGAAFLGIVAGILLIRYSGDLTFRELRGAHWALIAMVAFAITDMAGKFATMRDGQTFPTLILMYGMGSLLFGLEALRGTSFLSKVKPGDAVPDHAELSHIKLCSAELNSTKLSNENLGYGEPDVAGLGKVELCSVKLGNGKSDAEHGNAGLGNVEFGNRERGDEKQGNEAGQGNAGKHLAARWGTGKTLFVGMAVGISNISGMVLLLPAFRLGVTGLVSAIIALNVLLVILYARVVLRDTFTRLELAGMTMAVCGILVLRLLG